MRVTSSFLVDTTVLVLLIVVNFRSTECLSSTSSIRGPVAVIGTTGRLGREAVVQLSSQSIPVRCLLRTLVADDVPATLNDATSTSEIASYLSKLPGVTMIRGDVNDQDSLDSLLDGCTAVLALQGAPAPKPIFRGLFPFLNPTTSPTHPFNINYLSMQRILNAAKKSGSCKRVVRITGKGETPFSIFSILINALGNLAKAWNYEGELVLRKQNEIDYTIIRPGVMSSEVKKGKKMLALKDNGGDLKVSSISYSDIASLCIKCSNNPNAARSTLTAMTVPEGEGSGTWDELLQGVNEDTRVFPENMLAEHKKATRMGGVAITAVLFGLMSGIVKIVVGIIALIGRQLL